MEETNNMNDSFSEVKIIKPKPVRLCQNSKKKKFKNFINIIYIYSTFRKKYESK